jgi:SpoVK/Ycf46/Vps4 family AAA+-type ATPase
MMGIAIDSYIKAGYPVLYVQTKEQERALSEICRNLKSAHLDTQFTILLWKSTHGLYPLTASSPSGEAVAVGFDDTLQYISGSPGEDRKDCLYILFNPREFMKSPVTIQRLRDAAYKVRTVGSHMVMIGGHYEIPEELEDVVTFVDLELPNRDEIKAIFRSVVDQYATALKDKATEADLTQAAENALGLTEFKAENAISLSIVSSSRIDIPLIRKEKQLAVKQSGVLEFIHHNETADTLGGFDVLKDHVVKRRGYFINHQNAVEFGLRPPKGIMLVGVAGTGKSLAAKAVSAALDLPLYKFDVGAVFKGIVGSSEASIRSALKLAETVSPCVLLIDEMEKLVAGLESSGRTDSGVTSRVIGTLISWMQETQSPVYKIATCNTIRNLDSALFRRGRWDAVFAVDLPTAVERRDIFLIHLKKRGRDPKNFDVNKLALATENFVGAEIESVVDEALYLAFFADRDVSTDDLLEVCKHVIPISKTDKEAIEQFREWMRARATSVSSGRERVGDKQKNGEAGVSRNLRVTG